MEPFLTNNGKYRIENLSPTTIPGALKILEETFCKEESVCIGTEVSEDPIAIEGMLQIGADAMLDGISLVAIAVDTGEVVATAINKLHEKPESEDEKPYFVRFSEEKCTQPCLATLLAWSEDLDEKVKDAFDKYDFECSFELLYLATDKKHRGHKLGLTLSKASVELARKLKNGSPVAKIELKDLGPKYANILPRKPITKVPQICQALWTAGCTHKIGKALGFNVELRVSFRDYVYNGKTFEERIGHEEYAEYTAKVLD